MADKVVELRKTQEEAAPRRPWQRSLRASRARLRLVLLVVIPLIALAVGAYFYLMSGPLHLDRQRLCGRAEGADHAGHLRQDRQGHGDRGSARQCRRRADRDRSRAVPHQRDAGRGAARRRAHRIRQPEDQSRLDWRGASRSRARPLDLKQRDVERKNTLLANRTGSQVDMDNALDAAGHGEDAARTAGAAAGRRSATSCSAIPICRSRNIRPTRRPPPRSIRPSAISTTPCCARRSPAWRRRSRASRWAATSRPARRCSA